IQLEHRHIIYYSIIRKKLLVLLYVIGFCVDQQPHLHVYDFMFIMLWNVDIRGHHIDNGYIVVHLLRKCLYKIEREHKILKDKHVGLPSNNACNVALILPSYKGHAPRRCNLAYT
ncbi:hypothetical protein ACJX0J_018369, partial [Zea mays]